MDGSDSRVGMDGNSRRYSVRQAELVCGGHTVWEKPCLVTAPDRIDYGGVNGVGCLPREVADAWCVIQAAVDAADMFGYDQPLESFVDCRTGAKVEKIDGSPNASGGLVAQPVDYPRSKV